MDRSFILSVEKSIYRRSSVSLISSALKSSGSTSCSSSVWSLRSLLDTGATVGQRKGDPVSHSWSSSLLPPQRSTLSSGALGLWFYSQALLFITDSFSFRSVYVPLFRLAYFSRGSPYRSLHSWRNKRKQNKCRWSSPETPFSCEMLCRPCFVFPLMVLVVVRYTYSPTVLPIFCSLSLPPLCKHRKDQRAYNL